MLPFKLDNHNILWYYTLVNDFVQPKRASVIIFTSHIYVEFVFVSVLNELYLFNAVFFYLNKDFILCENDTGLYLCISKSIMVVILAFFISTKTPYGDWNILERRNANE